MKHSSLGSSVHVSHAWLVMLLCWFYTSSLLADEYTEARRQLVQEIEADVRVSSQYLGKQKLDPHVMKSMGKVLRHKFVPNTVQSFAYLNRPLPIGYGQTISRQYKVAK